MIAVAEEITSNGNRAIHVASRNGDVQAVYSCLSQSAGACGCVDMKSATGKTPLMIASSMGHLEVAKVLVTHGADVNYHAPGYLLPTPLLLAMWCGHSDVAKWFVSVGGADISDTDKALRDTVFKGHTTASFAAYFGHLDVVEFLVSTGKSTTRSTLSPLYAAASNNKLDVVTYLLDIDRSVIDQRNPGSKLTPLGITALCKYDMCSLSLLAARANVDTIPRHISLPCRMTDILSHWSPDNLIEHTSNVRIAISNAIPRLHPDVVYHTHTCYTHTHTHTHTPPHTSHTRTHTRHAYTRINTHMLIIIGSTNIFIREADVTGPDAP